ncbi:hypothetical protein AMTR_s00136p00100260 [Amborella trichopoda]|uniref:Uncharacterized protein n=1 Tax=Amborella trichopoda TaxID=13333 RepID=W1NEZ8_AMBTC|nr:hypothetical protein AMTR_s00136p00100260 [Amborella trichopoda]
MNTGSGGILPAAHACWRLDHPGRRSITMVGIAGVGSASLLFPLPDFRTPPTGKSLSDPVPWTRTREGAVPCNEKRPIRGSTAAGGRGSRSGQVDGAKRGPRVPALVSVPLREGEDTSSMALKRARVRAHVAPNLPTAVPVSTSGAAAAPNEHP